MSTKLSKTDKPAIGYDPVLAVRFCMKCGKKHDIPHPSNLCYECWKLSKKNDC